MRGAKCKVASKGVNFLSIIEVRVINTEKERINVSIICLYQKVPFRCSRLNSLKSSEILLIEATFPIYQSNYRANYTSMSWFFISAKGQFPIICPLVKMWNQSNSLLWPGAVKNNPIFRSMEHLKHTLPLTRCSMDSMHGQTPYPSWRGPNGRGNWLSL